MTDPYASVKAHFEDVEGVTVNAGRGAQGLKVGKKDVLSTDPVADADARVVEVDIRLDDAEPAAALTNLRVDVTIEP